MKKNLMIKIASLMLVLTLASTCMIGTTFAKYVTEDHASDTARVAKWGITVATSGTLFGTKYASTTAGTNADSIVSASDHVASLTDKIVAPGTKNDVGFQVKLSGTPEVAYSVDADNGGLEAEDIYLAAGKYGVMVPVYGVNDATDLSTYYTLSSNTYTAATTYSAGTTYYALHDEIDFSTGDDYYPINWTVDIDGDDKDASLETTGGLTLVKIAEDLIGSIDLMEGVANNELDAIYTLKWSWDYGTSAITDADKKDTILGNLMATGAGVSNVVVLGSDGNYHALTVTDGVVTSTETGDTDTYANLQVAFGIKITVTQVD